MDRKILHYLRKEQKIHIGMLNNHINYTFIDIITYIITSICKHHLKRPKTSKCDTLLRFFYLSPTDTLSTLEWKNLVYWDFIFHLGSTKPSVKLRKIIRNQSCLGSSKSCDPTNPE